MKCLSIRQPWSWAILHAGKDIENRSWRTGFRGRVLIHAGKRLDFQPRWTDWEGRRDWLDLGGAVADLHLGAIVGVATLVDCLPHEKVHSRWAEHTPGTYGFVLTDQRAFKETIPYNGRLGLFDVPASVVREALQAVGLCP